MRHFLKFISCLIVAILLAGCTARHYRKSADKEVYRIIQQKEKAALGKTNAFSIDTRYSQRKPDDIKAKEIIEDRMRETKQTVTLSDALRIALENSREYQLRKEGLYLSALNLTRARFEYVPQFFANTEVTAQRVPDQDTPVRIANRFGVANLLKTGGRVGLNLANDILRFYSGGSGDSARSAISLTLSQPLLRGAGARIVAENLTQAERNVIYQIREFSFYQDEFALGIVARYLQLLRQQDTVKNEYNNFLSSVSLRERSVALSVDRLAPFQADQAVQEELTARNRYIFAVENYRTALDAFKVMLALPPGYEIQLDESALTELEAVGLLPIPLTDEQAFRFALERRSDLLNDIDRFEDSKRKIVVAANALKPDLVVFGEASLPSQGQTDYARFDLNDYTLVGGLQLDLPLNRKPQRNTYRETIIDFEVQLRELARVMDTVRTGFRDDLRNLGQHRQTYEIQNRAKQLADRRVESSQLSLQAGRVQVRDVLDAQQSRLAAYNAATAALVDYHLARMRLLLNLGILNTEKEKFWLDPGEVPKTPEAVTPAPPAVSNQLITPEELFKNEKR